MQLETIARTIQLILAPVVMVSACALLLNGLLARYGSINDHLRNLARERLDLLRRKHAALSDVDAPLDQERLLEIDYQLPLIMSHHRLTHDAVLAVYTASAIFIADMFVIALGAFNYTDLIGVVVLLLFLCGTVSLFVGVLLTGFEVRTSHHAVHYEVRRVMGLE